MNKNTNKMIAIITIFVMCIFTMVGCKNSSNSTETTVETPTDVVVDVVTTEDIIEVVTTEVANTTIATTEENTSEAKPSNTEDNNQNVTTTEEIGTTTEAVTTESTTEATTQSTTENTTETTTEHIHNWVAQYDTIHHDAVTEEVEVTKQVPVTKSVCTNKCKSCGWIENPDGSNGTYDEHIANSPTEIIILWGEEHEVKVCRDGCQAVWVDYTVYETQTVTETRIISEAYDEKVIVGYICTICGSSK